MRRGQALIAIIVLIVLLILGGCKKEAVEPQDTQVTPNENTDIKEKEAKTEENKEATGEDGIADEKNQESILGVHIGNKAPSFELENYLGEIVALEDYKGKPVIVTFWVSWSQEALEQLHVLENVSILLGEDAAFIGIHVESFDTLTKDEAIELINDNQYTYEMVFDGEAKVHQEYYVGIYPTTYIIDPIGKIAKSYTTLVEEDQILEDLEHILSQLLQ
ncbi:TlpA family protein disulfide reductase [Alkaliphilus pronyensis]|uniref:TlpA family protein disulfide reductase n=1 Tax=Alkaliphilus pronyensis TaxID=1482732 RepID=A0A6I0FHD9_9FIRM|nr:TlpA disulfide reductase family protein [Alkaliphilus pronyensis]KAB3537818.1 TlpA family protein disulfide reductase [Alkaliphilus pronyensis]